MKFKLNSKFGLMGDQPQAVEKLVKGIEEKDPYQVLLGVTGSGKTFTVANVIERTQRPTLVISHNKTLAAQLYQELRDFFPENAVSYFVSYYDYYQPEAYIPSTDTYIEKDAGINELIDKLRLAATTNILTRNDVIVVASVSSIYNIGSSKEFGKFILEISKDMKVSREQIIDRLTNLQYERSDFGFHRGTFRVNGDIIDVYPAYEDFGVKIELKDYKVFNIQKFDPLTGVKIDEAMKFFVLYPSKHFVTDPNQNKDVYERIAKDMLSRVNDLKKEGKELEAHRLQQKVTYDLEMIREVGYVKGIENYSRYFDGRNPGDAPFSLLDYFNDTYGKDWLTVVDESHITFPQIRGMFAGDFSRKQTLIEYGFRLPSALDNRPLKFDEFMRRIPNFIAVSATPDDWEISMSKNHIVQQLVRPTGIVDPTVEIRPTATQVKDVIEEIKKNAEKGERTLVTTLTKRTAEDVANYLVDQGIKAEYLHSDIKTLERTDILDNLRRGDYDALIGVNLLREGLDLPEVSLVAILDADKEGFLRSEVSLVQTMGRAARHVKGRVILYANKETNSMKKALDEIKRRREYQTKWNEEHNITPTSIQKPIRERLVEEDVEAEEELDPVYASNNIDALTPMDKRKLVKRLKREMKIAADDMNFELAAKLRDKIKELE
ncbi:MAG TPA: excinuclease ABC subunit UvrB [Patescibacteria group bacterium]|nr:excinuclease ABC subunit UvrB [Patescibacteria group bacterium]